MHETLEVEESWQCPSPFAYLMITAIDPSSALLNAAEIENIFAHRYRNMNTEPTSCPSKLHLLHSKNRYILICLYIENKTRISFLKNCEKVICVINIGLHTIGVIRQPIADVYFFEKKLNATGNTDDIRKLLQQNTTYPELLKKIS